MSCFWDDALCECLSSGHLADVRFTFPNEPTDELDPSSHGVTAHRLLLSLASPVFKVLLDPQSGFEMTTEIVDMTESAFRLLIECIYSGSNAPRVLTRPNIALKDFTGAFYGMKKYQVDHLRSAFVNHVQTRNLDIQNVLTIFGTIRHWADETELTASCLQQIRAKFISIEWSKEHMDIFQYITSLSDIIVRDEIILFRTALKLDCPLRALCANIRFPLMSQRDLLEEVWPTGVLTTEEFINVLKRISGDMVDCGFSVHPRNNLSHAREFKYVSDFDQNGIIYYLGQQQSDVWQNPHEHLLTLKSSSVDCLFHDVSTVTSRSSTLPFWTRNELHSWIQIDFGPKHMVCPTAYTLRHGFSKPRDGIRNWVLEGSKRSDKDGDYEILRCHTDDRHLGNAPFDTHTWSIQNPRGTEFRYLRLRQIGPGNGAQDKFKHHFTISGVEFYGWLCLY
jgi:hypothetical protein